MNIRKLILLLNLFIVFCANTQPVVYKKAAHDLTPFTGTWTASKSDMKYEITFKKGTLDLKLDTNYRLDVVLASIKWHKKEKLIREEIIDGRESVLIGTTAEGQNPLYLNIIYSDKKIDANFNGVFIIDHIENPSKAELIISPAIIITNGARKKSIYDIPRKLEFIKIR